MRRRLNPKVQLPGLDAVDIRDGYTVNVISFFRPEYSREHFIACVTPPGGGPIFGLHAYTDADVASEEAVSIYENLVSIEDYGYLK